MKKIFASLALILCVGLFARVHSQQGGGTTTPQFQFVGISPDGSGAGCASAGVLLCMERNASAIVELIDNSATGQSAILMTGPSFTPDIELCASLATNGCGTGSIANDVYLAAGPNTQTFHIGQYPGGTGDWMTFTGTNVVKVNGFRVPNISYGPVDQTAAATCTILSLANGQQQNLASVACSATGNTTVTFTTAYTTNPPLCQVSLYSTAGSGWTVAITGFTTTTVSVATYVAGVLTNNIPYSLVCYGN